MAIIRKKLFSKQEAERKQNRVMVEQQDKTLQEGKNTRF